jgi:hypothetical protein
MLTFTPQMLYNREKLPHTHWRGGWVGPRAGLGKKKKKKKISAKAKN